MWERTLAGLPRSKDPPVLLWSWLTAFTISAEIKTAKGRADGGVWCQPPETEEPKELEDSCLSSSSRKQGVSAVLTLGWQAALPFCEPGLDVPGAGGMVGGRIWRKGVVSRQVQAQELVGLGACLGLLQKPRKGPRFPHFLPFSLRLSFVIFSHVGCLCHATSPRDNRPGLEARTRCQGWE